MQKNNDYILKIVGFGILAIFGFYVFSYNQNKINTEEIKYKTQYITDNLDTTIFSEVEQKCISEVSEYFYSKDEKSAKNFCENMNEAYTEKSYDMASKIIKDLQSFDISDYKDDTYLYKP